MIIFIKTSFNMKRIFFIFLCTYLLASQGILAQTTINYSFKIWKNSVTSANELGTFSGTASTDDNVAEYHVTTAPMLGQLCPGDQLIIKNYSYKSQNNNSFQALNFNTSSLATIALTSSNLVTASTTLLGSVCQSAAPCLTGTPNFGSWLYSSTVTVTIPDNPQNDNYLAIGNNIFGTSVCGLVAFIPINLAPSTSIADQVICSGDAVTIPTVSGFTYTNWSPNNPNITTPTTETDYTVDITHSTGCTQEESFTIDVINPDVDLSLVSSLCYNESTIFTFDDIVALAQGPNGTTSPLSLTTSNGTTIFDINANIFNYPHLIDAANYGAGIVTLDYTYGESGTICTKSYEIIIHPEIVLNMQSAYGFCSNNFQPIFANSNGILGQPDITYIWTQTGVPFSVGSGPYFTPSSYGTYHVTASDDAGCRVRHTFTVYDSGVGIQHPANITFCSMTQRSPSYIGWSSDPFGAIDYGFSWTYTNLNGDTYPISNTGALYQVPYLGPGTYTTVVTANGCTETISIVVTDLLQIHNNHPAADFNFTPLFGNQVSCQPSSLMLGVNNIWTVVDENGAIISTIPYLDGIRFPYYTGVEYTVTLRREYPRGCQVYINQFTWLDGSGESTTRGRKNVSNDNTSLNFEPTTVSTFPNPTTGLVNIQLKGAETTETSIKVLNALGQVILEKQVQNNSNIEVDLSKEISGLYILHIVNGTTQFTEKIIKE
jgi:hypothetical protein